MNQFIHLHAILHQFQLIGNIDRIEPIEIGHINQTYKVILEKKDGQLYQNLVLQQINTQVFKQPLAVMFNIEKVGQFLKSKQYPKAILQPIESVDGQNIVEVEGAYWRLYPFISNTQTFNEVLNEEMAFAAAFAFGEYGNYLKDFPVEELLDTIPDFHNTALRFDQFLETVEDAPFGQLILAEEPINQLLSYEYLLKDIGKLTFPIRVTHNDTKINNILFDKTTGKAVCVIDLDTLMPGNLLYDFGDMVRTFTPALDENSDKFEEIFVRKNILTALTKGYLAGWSGALTQLETTHLIYGAQLTIFEQALRFLTDYLNGNIYYKVANEEQNLVRAKNQICLLESLLKI